MKDNDSRGRGPRKGGGSGSRGGGKGPAGKSFGSRPGGEGRGPAGDGERRPFRGHADGNERPARRFERPAGDERPAPSPRRFDGDRPARFKAEGEGRGFRPRTGEERQRRPERDAAPERKLIAAAEPERIAKVMARAGVASRRDSEAMIAEGRVSVNGTVLASPAFDVKPTDTVLVDGEPLPARERTRLWLHHKPRGVVTTNFDPEGRPTVFDALPEDLPRVLTIGRLDINTEGLLLLTNDGGLARVLELPETGWLRRYRVRAFGEVTQDVLDTVKDGVTVDGIQYGPVIARFERRQGSNTWLTVDLREGKNREVKTVLEHLGLTVNRLIRVSFGPFQLGDLAEGEAEEIRSRVLQDQLGVELAAKAGADFESPRRDALPAAPRAAPAAEDRPRRRPVAKDGPDETARPSRGDRPWTRTVWRDAEAEPQRARKAPPRRGADPKLERQEREASGTLQRRRDTPIADPKGRRVLVERISAPTTDEPAAPARDGRRRPDRKPRPERGEEARAPRSFARPGDGERPMRRSRAGEAGGRERVDERPRQERAPREERPAEDRPRGRGFGDKPGGKSFGGKSFGGKGFGGKGSAAKSLGSRSSERPGGGGRPFGGKPGGGRPSGRGPRPGGGAPRGGKRG
ncbi:pseudouridine synthase [Bosea sp. (in: a-proteobacteria)]|uniref:pseudouridine synthase n=1 Tax=Bosea sp. (in: a-proteobacteria) TaxID=1871050 RepID=UPI0026241287|nr:pseudouridine synthase [Bosea sp. (in: a-proteobacteria)]MCO5092304.1 pseudouridine synthase [Bosea sp. (in: a-proteobacteria)]